MALRIIPLGGLGEIGMNCMVLEREDARVVVDCGVMFPSETMFGVDVIVPDFGYLKGTPSEPAKTVDALLVTHGHEDHIGAIPFLLEALLAAHGEPLPPVYATRFTRALIRERLVQHDLWGKTDVRIVEPSAPFRVGSLGVEYLKVTHSIVDACGIAFETPEGNVVHSGDFKIDPTPPDGEAFDRAGFSRYGDAGVSLLMSDSTNAERPGHTPSERVIEQALDGVFTRAKGRLVVAMFASHVPRMRQVAALCAKHGRRLVFEGRSMIRNAGIARDLGLLRMAPGVIAETSEALGLPDERVAILCTGSQAEPTSALVRMAVGTHPELKIGRGDTVVLSSRMIPGNEREITNLVNQLYRCGAAVVYEALEEIHSSGHGHREELETMLSLTRPKAFVPIHGEYRHLVQHAELAAQRGVETANARVVENGAILELDRRGLRVVGAAPSGRVLVDPAHAGGVDETVLADRLAMARTGLVVVFVGITGTQLVRGPEVFTRGLVTEALEPELSRRASAVARETLDSIPEAARTETREIAEALRLSMRRFFNKELSQKPFVVPLVLPV